MDRNQAKELLPIIKAFSEGKTIEMKCAESWIEIEDICDFHSSSTFRIKPEPKYRPFKDKKECWAEMLKHQPFGWVKSTLFKDLALVQRVTILYVEINRDIIDYKDTLEKFTFADGTPFGIKEEE